MLSTILTNIISWSFQKRRKESEERRAKEEAARAAREEQEAKEREEREKLAVVEESNSSLQVDYLAAVQGR